MKDIADWWAIGGLLAGAGVYVLTKLKQWKDGRRAKLASGIRKNTVIDSGIYPVLWKTMHAYGALRTFIVQFHNGSKFYTGQHIQRMTVSHEVIDSMIVRKTRDYHDGVLIREMEHRILSELNTGEYYWFDDIAELRNDSYNSEIVEWMEVYGVKSAYVFRIMDKKTKETVATFNIHFKHVNPLNALQIGEIIQEVRILEAIFDKL